jgi:hypothetical protein
VEADLRLKRLYDAIESGMADLDGPALKDRIAGRKSIRDQAGAKVERTVRARKQRPTDYCAGHGAEVRCNRP